MIGREMVKNRDDDLHCLKRYSHAVTYHIAFLEGLHVRIILFFIIVFNH